MIAAPSITFSGAAEFSGAPLFDNITLEIKGGEWTCLLGPSGVGKTTVLRIIAGLDSAVNFRGKIISSDGKTLQNRTAYMAQNDLLFPWLTLLDNVCIGATLRGDHVEKTRAIEMISRVGLAGHEGKKPSQLSGGQRQRGALARTLMEDRPVILLDEPFSALDAKTRADMQELAAELLTDRTVLLVTHDPAEAARLSHQAIVMHSTGLQHIDMPATPPVRGIDDPQTLATQGKMLKILREGPQ
ncbi:ABC transporter ATP-binding protein [Amylibacter kogurei]|uniref:ABC transporter ATP-binding protein n=1 Tax=Paramylibacter kogurei TaxID=1889778 RepID=A0A2G5K8K9_9RHOB|nr:ABC transporter ATP-binding protein [Amylibacter kogurei]PIB25866.1 ABC transporter ATP-binding protein [Amylibacter kogurei]